MTREKDLEAQLKLSEEEVARCHVEIRRMANELTILRKEYDLKSTYVWKRIEEANRLKAKIQSLTMEALGLRVAYDELRRRVPVDEPTQGEVK